ncbi:MAG: lysophospholipid acyltransferase family protein [Deltaproteobacteria bacterium]|nr:lysophospholipid acyltransferase family protein [Deltaproteobacteria bacterium]
MKNIKEKTLAFEKQLKSLLPGWLYKLLGISKLVEVYPKTLAESKDKSGAYEDFAAAFLRVLNVKVQVAEQDLRNIPTTGPVMIVANHPFGGLEGVFLIDLLRRIRKDSKLLANYLLNYIPEFGQYIIPVDPFGTEKATRVNVNPIKNSIKWLKAGNLLGIFPSGTVSYLHLLKREVVDPIWNKNIVKIIKNSEATVVPIFIHGRNSVLFQILGLIHPRLRTATLAREMMNKQNRTIAIDIGKPIPFKKIEGMTDQEAIEYLRLRTFVFKNKSTIAGVVDSDLENYEPIIPAVAPNLLEQEINSLTNGHRLCSSGEMDVYCAKAVEIPGCLREIGRLREVTFRLANEGTGKSIDLDLFDNHYYHLFIWHKTNKKIIGAYRIGRVDEILEHYGVTGLYTYTLWKYSEKLLAQIQNSLELGRSFVVWEYHKNPLVLFSLWKGIATFVYRYKHYRYLFGPVSISNDYDSVSRQLIISFLKAHNFLPTLAKMIKPRKSYKNIRIKGIDKNFTDVVRDVHEVSGLIAEIEKRERAIPVLLKHYLKLGGKILGFNVDPDFGNVLDGLILVDLVTTEEKVLAKYMNKHEVAEYKAFHKILGKSPL